jgi:thymidylate kinase
VTVSGMVGTGKTTTVKHILDVLRREGVDADQWRFQRLPCITLGRRSAATMPREPTDRKDRAPRGQGYRARVLTSGTALGYVVRTFAFRVYRRWTFSPRWVVSNRYFYDSFAHFDLSVGRGRLYARVLRRLVPKPDLAILMVASPEALAARRPQYSIDYIKRVEAAYRGLRELFPELIEVNSEMDDRALERVAIAVRRQLGRT